MDVANGDICQLATHNCSTIVNAANMEVSFGDGVSRIIGDATGERANINNEAKTHIDEFNRRISEVPKITAQRTQARAAVNDY